jgi:hypothetical protein
VKSRIQQVIHGFVNGFVFAVFPLSFDSFYLLLFSGNEVMWWCEHTGEGTFADWLIGAYTAFEINKVGTPGPCSNCPLEKRNLERRHALFQQELGFIIWSAGAYLEKNIHS